MIKHLEEIVEAAKRGPKRRLIAAYAQDSHTHEYALDETEFNSVVYSLDGV